MKAIMRSNHAVTLVELLVVMAIIAMLAGVLGLAVPSIGAKVNDYRAETDIKNLMAVLEFYRKDCGQFPEAINHMESRGIVDVSADIPATKALLDERSNKQANFTPLVWALGSTHMGWSKPKLWDVFTRDRLKGGALADPWGNRIFYMSAISYRRNYGGTLLTSGNAASAPFANAGSYQIYSAGENGQTPTDSSNNAGTDPDDLRNW